MKEIKLTKGYVTTVDDEDYERVAKYKWQVSIHKYGTYATGSIKINGVYKNILLHRFILGVNNPVIKVDHADGNQLNNQKRNLRMCTLSENNSNRKSQTGSSSKYVGINFHKQEKRIKRWGANIQVNNKTFRLGRFKTEYDAAIARDIFIIKNNLEFPRLNILKRDTVIIDELEQLLEGEK